MVNAGSETMVNTGRDNGPQRQRQPTVNTGRERMVNTGRKTTVDNKIGKTMVNTGRKTTGRE